jgi:hypothetical protein
MMPQLICRTPSGRGGIDGVRAESGDVSDGLGGDVPSAADIGAWKGEDLEAEALDGFVPR